MRKRRLKRRLAHAVRGQDLAQEEARRGAYEALRLRLALQALPQSLVVWDEEGRVVLRNRPDLDPALPRSGEALVDAAMDDLVQAGAASEPVTRTLELRGPPPRQLMLRALPLHHGEQRLGAVAIVDDVSERRQLEAVRRDFVANVSHELRTPVGALALLGEALCGESDPDVVSRLAGRITAEAERAARMIEDLLDLSRIEGGGPLPRRKVSVDRVLSAPLERSRPVAELREVCLERSSRQATDVWLMGDEAQIVSALANLVDNAVKYSDAGSSVRVSARMVDGCVNISVRDRGIGIPGKDLQRIFERFYRVDRARSRDTGGTGLGLSIVRHVATNHGGVAATRLASEFDGTFNSETIELFLATSYDQFAGRATVVNFLPLMAERFARQRLKALAKVEGMSNDGVPVVLFLCVHNAGRSQMALGWFNHLAGERAVAWSGGSEPGNEINPAAVAAMAEIGIDISEEFPKPWTEEIVQAADVVVTMGCGDACPLFPGKRYEDWVLSDPFGKSVEEVRPVRDEIGRRVGELLASLGVLAREVS